MARRLTALGLVYSVAATIPDELRAMTKGRSLAPGEARQLATAEALADALRVAAREDNQPEFREAFAPMAGLFEAADAATRAGGIPVPSHAKRYPVPITPAHLAWFGVSGIVCCLVLISQTPAAGRPPRRLAQLEVLVELQTALAELTETGPDAPAAARVQDLFVAAEGVIGDEFAAIVTEAATIATEAAAGRPN